MVANGLSFSVGKRGYCPPSLRNIITEMEDDIGAHPLVAKAIKEKDYRDIWGEDLAKQGVLMLNTTLTVERGKPNSHSKIWEEFTDEIIHTLLEETEQVVWILWGAHARDKVLKHQDILKQNNHKVIITSHPSPFSADRSLGKYPSFKGSKPFTTCNLLLSEMGKEEIRWINGTQEKKIQ